jgi:hypothetical protein
MDERLYFLIVKRYPSDDSMLSIDEVGPITYVGWS